MPEHLIIVQECSQTVDQVYKTAQTHAGLVSVGHIWNACRRIRREAGKVRMPISPVIHQTLYLAPSVLSDVAPLQTQTH